MARREAAAASEKKGKSKHWDGVGMGMAVFLLLPPAGKEFFFLPAQKPEGKWQSLTSGLTLRLFADAGGTGNPWRRIGSTPLSSSY